jgi:hypothetical protein
MKQDKAIAEVRNARKALCDRFENNPKRLLEHLREQQQNYKGRIIKATLGAKPDRFSSSVRSDIE